MNSRPRLINAVEGDAERRDRASVQNEYNDCKDEAPITASMGQPLFSSQSSTILARAGPLYQLQP